MPQARPATRKPLSALLPAAALAVLVVLALTALAALAPAHAAEVEGIGVDDAVQLDGAWLELNGEIGRAHV